MEGQLIDSFRLSKYTIKTTDKEIGKIKDLYFDEVSGHIRYFVVDTELFLFRNLVLVSPISISKMDESNRVIELNISSEKLENSPKFDSVNTISRLYERAYNEYFSWPNYWESMHGPWVLGPFGIPWRHYENDDRQENLAKSYFKELEDCHLRSVGELKAYRIATEEEQFGHVQSIIFNNKSFKIEFWVVDTINFIPSKLVLLPYELSSKLYWRTKTMEVNSTKDQIKEAPEYHCTNEGTLSYDQVGDVSSYFGRSA